MFLQANQLEQGKATQKQRTYQKGGLLVTLVPSVTVCNLRCSIAMRQKNNKASVQLPLPPPRCQPFLFPQYTQSTLKYSNYWRLASVVGVARKSKHYGVAPRKRRKLDNHDAQCEDDVVVEEEDEEVDEAVEEIYKNDAQSGVTVQAEQCHRVLVSTRQFVRVAASAVLFCCRTHSFTLTFNAGSCYCNSAATQITAACSAC